MNDPRLPDHRAEVLAAVRQALARPHPHADAQPLAHTLAPTPGLSLLDTFKTAARAVGTEVFCDQDLETLMTMLSAELRRERGVPIDHPLLIVRPPYSPPGQDGLGRVPDPFEVDLAVVPATLGIATLGSVLLDGPRLYPMTAEVTVAVLDRKTLVPTLHDALVQHRTGSTPGPTPGPTRLIITGPSKTADIEGVLITGVHGPRRFVVLVT